MRRADCSRRSSLGQFRVDGLLHGVIVMPLRKLGAVDQDRRRAVDSLRLGLRNRSLDTCSLLAAIETLIERPGIEPQRFGHLFETSVRKTVRAALIQVEGVVVPPVGVLIGRAGGGFGGLYGLLATKCIVVKFEPDPAGLDVVSNELRFHRTGELFAAWSGEV